jgi:AcrR family transcriptional regulator
MVKKREPYISYRMIERRQRLIDATKEIISDKGADAFTIREVARTSGVSITTIYSTYGDKEGLIAAAIEDFYGQLPVAHHKAPATINGVLRTMTTASKTILSNASYSRSLADLYFSRTAEGKVHELLQQLAINIVDPWVDATQRKNDIIPGVGSLSLCRKFANDRWSTIFQWARGQIADNQLADALKLSFLIAAAGVTRGETRQSVDSTLARLITRM